MKRREFITLLGGAAAAWPLAARAQQPAMPVIGFLRQHGRQTTRTECRGVSPGPEEAGYVEGQNVAIEYRWAEGQYDRLPALAADLVRRQVTVIVATGGTLRRWQPRRRPRRSRSSSASAPIRSRSVSSPASTGRAATSRASLFVNASLAAKRLELLRELVPERRRVAMLVNPTIRNTSPRLRDVQAAARASGSKSIPQGQHRTRDRRGLCERLSNSGPRALRRSRRSILHQPARSTRRAGGPPCAARDLSSHANSPKPAA